MHFEENGNYLLKFRRISAIASKDAKRLKLYRRFVYTPEKEKKNTIYENETILRQKKRKRSSCVSDILRSIISKHRFNRNFEWQARARVNTVNN